MSTPFTKSFRILYERRNDSKEPDRYYIDPDYTDNYKTGAYGREALATKYLSKEEAYAVLEKLRDKIKGHITTTLSVQEKTPLGWINHTDLTAMVDDLDSL